MDIKRILSLGLCIALLGNMSGVVYAEGTKQSEGEILKALYESENRHNTNGDMIKSRSLVTSIAEGNRVYKVGSTTYKNSGVIKSTNYTATFNGVTFTNLTKTSSMSESGDSGGLVYVMDGEYNIIVGIVKGTVWSGIFRNSVYVKASEIANQMEIYPY